MRNFVLRPNADTTVLHAPATLMTADARVRAHVTGSSGAAAYLIAPTTESGLIQFRFSLRDIRMWAIEDTFTTSRQAWGRGTTIIPAAAGLEKRLRKATESHPRMVRSPA